MLVWLLEQAVELEQAVPQVRGVALEPAEPVVVEWVWAGARALPLAVAEPAVAEWVSAAGR